MLGKLLLGGLLALTGAATAVALGQSSAETTTVVTVTDPDRVVTIPGAVHQLTFTIPTVTVTGGTTTAPSATPTPLPTTPTATPTPTTTATQPPPATGLWSLPGRPRLPLSKGSVINATPGDFASKLAAAAAGGVIVLAPGDYAGIAISKAGTASEPITIVGQAGARFVATSNYSLQFMSGASYLRLQDIEVTNPAGSSSALIYFRDGSHDIEILHGNLHGHGTATPGSTAGVQGIFSGGGSARVQVWNTRIYDTGVAPKYDHGWYMNGSDHVLANSLIHDYHFGFGVQLYSNVTGAVIANCTIVQGLKSSIVTGGTSSGHLLVNDVFAFNGESAINTLSGSGNQTRNSLVWSPTSRGSAGMTYANITEADPQLGSDFRPASGSPVFGKADTAYMPPTDMDGRARVNAIGALD